MVLGIFRRRRRRCKSMRTEAETEVNKDMDVTASTEASLDPVFLETMSLPLHEQEQETPLLPVLDDCFDNHDRDEQEKWQSPCSSEKQRPCTVTRSNEQGTPANLPPVPEVKFVALDPAIAKMDETVSIIGTLDTTGVAAKAAGPNKEQPDTPSSCPRDSTRRHRKRRCKSRRRRPSVLTRNPDLVDMKPFWANTSEEAARQKNERREVQRQYLRWQQYYSCQQYQRRFQQERQLKKQQQLLQQSMGQPSTNCESHAYKATNNVCEEPFTSTTADNVIEEEQSTAFDAPTTTMMTITKEAVSLVEQDCTQGEAGSVPNRNGRAIAATTTAAIEAESEKRTSKVENVRLALSLVQNFYKKNGTSHASLLRHSSTTLISLEEATIEDDEEATEVSSSGSSTSSSFSSTNSSSSMDDIGSVPSTIIARKKHATLVA